MKFSDKIYYCRKKAGLSQEELAERLGVTRQSVSKWECGAALPELDKLAVLVSTFGVTADWLISDAEPEDNSDSSDEENTEQFEQFEQFKQNGASAYPDWVDKAPSLIGKFVRRFGWLFGVYVTVIGAIFSKFLQQTELYNNNLLSESRICDGKMKISVTRDIRFLFLRIIPANLPSV